MTTLPYNITPDANNAFSSNVDQAIQYREAFLGLHLALAAACDAVTFSCDGVAAAAGDNIQTTGDVVFGTEGSQALSYAVYRWGTDYLLLLANNANTDATPQQISFYKSGSPYALAGTPVSNRPTPTIAGREDTVLNINLISWATPGAGNWSSFASDDSGNVVFFTKVDGAGDASSAVIVHVLDPSGDSGGDGGPSIALYANGGGTAFAGSVISAAANWRANARDLASSATNPTAVARAWDFNNWTSGQASDLRGRLFPIHVGINSATATAARDFGLMRGVAGVPTATPANASDPQDPAGDLWHWRTLGDVAFLWRKSDGDIA